MPEAEQAFSHAARNASEGAGKTSEKLPGFGALLAIVAPWRGRFIAAMVASTVSMSFGVMFPLLVGKMWDAAIPSVKAIPTGHWRPDVDTVALILLGTLIIQAGLTFFSSYSFNLVGEQAVAALRTQLYGRLLLLPMRFFGEHRVGELTSRLSNDLAQIHDTITATVAAAIRQVMLLVGSVIIIAATSWKLALIMFSSFPILILVGLAYGKRVRKVMREAQDRLADSAVIVEETLQGISTVKSFANEPWEQQRYRGALDRYLTMVLRGSRYRAGLISFIIVGVFGAIVLVLWQGGRMMQAGELTHGELSTFVLCTVFVGGAVSWFGELTGQIQKSLGATDRLRELLREPGEIRSMPEANHAFVQQAHEPLKGHVRFDDVWFHYPSRQDLPVLKGIAIEAKQGEKIAIVGASGAGKSTMVSLLLGFYMPEQGAIRIDDLDIRTLSLERLRGNMAVVPQEVLLFGGTIRENIAYGRLDASESEILDAARRAHCHEFIERFPEGYSTVVGERGMKLSGGQRQRIAIARAILRNPAILILDEATSSLDSQSEALVQEALDALLEGRTAIIIAHRLATVRRVDRIYVVNGGRVVESGSHDELIDLPEGVYRKLATMQFQA